MKKILLVLLFSFSAAVQAEELKFVTVLSSPVGTFNRVEEVDSNTPVTSPVINFCTKRGSGNVQLNGRGNPTATTLNLASEAELGGNASEYRLQTLTMRYGGTLKGSRLLANTVNANTTPTLIKSSDIYASALSVQGAKTVGLNVGNGKSVMSGTESNREMVWSNEYQQDKNGATSADYAKQFLLKEKLACSPSYSSWVSAASGVDTCPGADGVNEFTCGGGFVGTCTDVRMMESDVSLGQTTEYSFEPPAGYEFRVSDFCSEYDHLNNRKIAVAFDSQYVRPTINYACASCSDISSGYLQDNLPWGFHLMGKNGGVIEWVEYGVITEECNEGMDGGWSACQRLCGVPWNDNKGCRTKKRCYQKPEFNNECGELTSCRSDIGNGWLVITCDEGAGGMKYLFKLKQCGGTKEKRTVTCCG